MTLPTAFPTLKESKEPPFRDPTLEPYLKMLETGGPLFAPSETDTETLVAVAEFDLEDVGGVTTSL